MSPAVSPEEGKFQPDLWCRLTGHHSLIESSPKPKGPSAVFRAL